jgi:hypothetical protein
VKWLTFAAILSLLGLTGFAQTNSFMAYEIKMRSRVCDGGHGAPFPSEAFGPVKAQYASTGVSGTYSYVTNEASPWLPVGLHWHPQNCATNWTTSWTRLAAGTLSTNVSAINFPWIKVKGYATIDYPNACCDAHGAFGGMELHFATTNWGGEYAAFTNDWVALKECPRGFGGVFSWEVSIRVGTNGNVLELDYFHAQPVDCAPTKSWPDVKPDVDLLNPFSPRMRSLISTGWPNTFVTIHTSSIASGNWQLATTFQYDANGEAQIWTTNWPQETNAFWFMLTSTNRPGTN